MQFSRPTIVQRRWTCRLISLALVCAVSCALVPLPLGKRVEKDLSEPFPCQHRACGCRSASQCWKKCCCFSNAQKVAWAKRHRVEVPGFVVAAAEREKLPQDGKSTRCCKHSPSHSPGKSAEPAQRDGKRQVTVIMLLAQQCQGQSWFWSALPWSVMPSVEAIRFAPQPTVETLALTSERTTSVCDAPPLPPPRCDARRPGSA